MRMTGSSKINVVDLFAGGGLFSRAWEAEGFKILEAIEIDPVAARTYARNVGDHIRVADIRSIRPAGRCDILVAGPPCQGFSTLGRRDPNDPRNRLSLEIIRWARVLQPSVIVVENVEAFLQAPIWNRLREELENMAYEVRADVLNAFDFGVPQLRKRSFTFASRIGLPIVRKLKRGGAQTVRDAWVGLAMTPDGRHQHVAPTPSTLALARMRIIPPGGDRRDVLRLAPELAPPSWCKLNGAVSDVWGRMLWDAPANTLRTCLQNASKGRYIHPEQHRVISLREAARIHTIKDDWIFEGTPTQIARQIGNSVPLHVGRAIARSVKALF
jgi:DNA (cytosine-5)-methyltransferase 1